MNIEHNKLQIGSNKSFGIVFSIFFLILFIYFFLNKGIINYLFIIISLLFLVLGLFNSKILYPLNYIWFKFGIILGKFISPLIMGIIFFFVVTPISLILKILGKDILNLKFNKNKTYWMNKSNIKSKMKNQY